MKGIAKAIKRIMSQKTFPPLSIKQQQPDPSTEHQTKKHKKDHQAEAVSVAEERKSAGEGSERQTRGSNVIVEFVTPKPGEAAALTIFAVRSHQDAYHTMKCSEEEACRVLAVDEEQIKYGQVEKMIDTDNEMLIGFYSLKSSIRESDKSIELGHVFVDQRYARQGMGSMLFRRAAESAYYRGASKMHFISDPNAVGFYIKLGASMTGHEQNLLDPSKDVAWMEYVIDSNDIYF
jgi:GNAT superfamily N-acetyltransferase